MKQTPIHWRTGGKITNAGCEMLPNGKDIEHIIIERIEFLDEHTINGKKESGVWVATFAANPYTALPMVLNSTNRKRLAKLFNTDYINTLNNIPVRLTQELTRDPQGGGQTYGLRISLIPATIPATTLPELNQSHPQWDQVIADVVSNTVTIEGLMQYFTITEEIKTILINEQSSTMAEE